MIAIQTAVNKLVSEQPDYLSSVIEKTLTPLIAHHASREVLDSSPIINRRVDIQALETKPVEQVEEPSSSRLDLFKQSMGSNLLQLMSKER